MQLIKFFPDVKPFRIQERAAGPRFLWLLVLLVNMAACDQKSKTGVTLFDDFDSKQWRQEFAGGSVLSSVQGFEFDRAEIFMADTTNNRVLRLNANLEVVDQIGGAGQGPGEFNFPGPLYVSDGLIFVSDEGNQKLQIFSRLGVYEHMFPVPRLGVTRFFFSDGFFYLPTPRSTHTISVYDIQGQPIQAFGVAFPSKNRRERHARSHAHLRKLMVQGEILIAEVSLTEPWARFYDRKGGLIFEHSFQQHPNLAARLDFQQKAYEDDPKNRESSYILFEDVFSLDDILYLMPAEESPYTHILAYKVSLSQLQAINTIRMPFDIERFAVADQKTLFAYDRDYGVLHRFEYVKTENNPLPVIQSQSKN